MADAYVSSSDPWQLVPGSPAWPARRAVAVTPSDTKDVTNPTGDNATKYAKALYVGVSGNLAVVIASDTGNPGTAVNFLNVPVGWFPVQVRRVMLTGTSATSIVGLYDQ